MIIKTDDKRHEILMEIPRFIEKNCKRYRIYNIKDLSERNIYISFLNADYGNTLTACMMQWEGTPPRLNLFLECMPYNICNMLIDGKHISYNNKAYHLILSIIVQSLRNAKFINDKNELI